MSCHWLSGSASRQLYCRKRSSWVLHPTMYRHCKITFHQCVVASSARGLATWCSNVILDSHCSKCGIGSHTHKNCNSKQIVCVNCYSYHLATCKGCPEVLVCQTQRVNILWSRTYTHWVWLCIGHLMTLSQASRCPLCWSKLVDGCWFSDQFDVSTSLTTGNSTPPWYAGVALGCGGQNGGGRVIVALPQGLWGTVNITRWLCT